MTSETKVNDGGPALEMPSDEMHTKVRDLCAALEDALTYIKASAFNISSTRGRYNYYACARRIEAALAKARTESSS